MSEGQQPEEKKPVQILLPPEQMAGVYANWAAVGHSPHEFTIDFVRMEWGETEERGVVVARVSVSPLFITQLIQALQDNWTRFAERSMPKEVNGDVDD